jgi:hypothetical protein
LGSIFSTSPGFSVNVTATPVPAAVLLFGSALAGLGVMRRRRKGEMASAAA